MPLSFWNEMTMADIWCLVSSFLVIGLKIKRTYIYDMCFVLPVFQLWFLVTFGDKVMKIWKYILCNLCLHFGRQAGKDRKKWKEIYATKVTKISKTKRQRCGMNKTLVSPVHDYMNICLPKFVCHSNKSFMH